MQQQQQQQQVSLVCAVQILTATTHLYNLIVTCLLCLNKQCNKLTYKRFGLDYWDQLSRSWSWLPAVKVLVLTLDHQLSRSWSWLLTTSCQGVGLDSWDQLSRCWSWLLTTSCHGVGLDSWLPAVKVLVLTLETNCQGVGLVWLPAVKVLVLTVDHQLSRSWSWLLTTSCQGVGLVWLPAVKMLVLTVDYQLSRCWSLSNMADSACMMNKKLRSSARGKTDSKSEPKAESAAETLSDLSKSFHLWTISIASLSSTQHSTRPFHFTID